MDNAEILINKLIEKNYTITTAESCTGGMISSKLIDVSGASLVVNECHVTYSNEAKMKYLNVDKEILDRFSAVSYEVAEQMVNGVSELASADVAISVTGLAGPGGGTKEKPVGLCKVHNKVKIDNKVFEGNRYEIRQQATDYAINMAISLIEE